MRAERPILFRLCFGTHPSPLETINHITYLPHRKSILQTDVFADLGTGPIERLCCVVHTRTYHSTQGTCSLYRLAFVSPHPALFNVVCVVQSHLAATSQGYFEIR